MLAKPKEPAYYGEISFLPEDIYIHMHDGIQAYQGKNLPELIENALTAIPAHYESMLSDPWINKPLLEEVVKELPSFIQQLTTKLMKENFPDYVSQKAKAEGEKPSDECDIQSVDKNLPKWPFVDGPGNDYY